MAYGIEVRNPRGSVMFSETEESYLYLGKVTFKHVVGSGSSISPFNIPLNVPFMAFVFAKGDGAAAAAYAPMLSGGSVVSFLESGDTLRSYECDVYLFVPARYIPTPAWGVAVYKQDGKVAYHSGRPMLQIDSFASISVTGNGNQVATISTHTANKKVACAMTFFGLSYSVRYEYGERWADENYHAAVAYRDVAGNYVVGKSVKTWQLPATDWHWAPEVTTKDYMIPLIDCAFYDQFSNYSGSLS